MANKKKTITPSTQLRSNLEQDSFVERNIEKLKALRSWFLWYPDLAFDLLSPSVGGLKLCFDQRVSMRCDSRFAAFHTCQPRGSAKTFGNIWVAIVDSIVLPAIEIAVSAQTKENAAELLNDKYSELLRWVPALQNEVLKYKHSNNDTEVLFRNKARFDILANAQSSKGQRRKRLRIEESNLVNDEMFQDALKPIVEVARYTCGKFAIADPCELNQQINFYTTPGWRGTDEHARVLSMIRDMVDLNGTMVLGADWMLPCWYGRGSSKSQILEKKKSMNPTAFAQNYGGEWTGTSSGALVSINKLLKCRNLPSPVFEASPQDEFYMAVDVARSQNEANNQSSIAIIRVKRNERGRITLIELCNIFNVSNVLNFSNQALIVKRMKNKYNARMVVVDGNGLGIGLIDELLKDTIDPMTGESLGCWNTINTTNEPEDPYNAEDCLFDMKAQSYQTKVLTDFIDVVDNGTLRLLEPKQYDVFAAERDETYQEKFMPFIQTDLLIDEIANLKLESNGRSLSVKKEVSRIDKDRFSALSYAIFYVLEFENTIQKQDYNLDDIFSFRAPQLRR